MRKNRYHNSVASQLKRTRICNDIIEAGVTCIAESSDPITGKEAIEAVLYLGSPIDPEQVALWESFTKGQTRLANSVEQRWLELVG